MSDLFLIRVSNLKAYYFDEQLLALSRYVNMLILLEQGKGMLFVPSGRDMHIKQFDAGRMVLFSDAVLSGFLLRHPRYADMLLFEPASQPAFIPVGLELEGDLSDYVDRLGNGLDNGVQLTFLMPLLDLLMVHAVEIYAAEKHVPLDTWQAGLMREFRILVNGNLPERWKTEDFAGKLGVTVRKLNEVCNRFTGRNVPEELKARRMAIAQRDLLLTSKPVHVIALELGYENHALFTTIFKKTKGVSPSEYRRIGGGG